MINNQCGFGMLGLVAMIALIGTLCAAVSIASLRSATGSMRGSQKIVIQAAAEGAAVAINTGETPTSGTLTIGNCQVLLSPGQTEAATSGTVRMTVNLVASQRVAYSRNYRVTPARPGTTMRLEAQP